MKQLGISIIGTDTDVGKTFVTGLLGACLLYTSRKKAIWIHRLNLIAIIAANIHVHGFGRLSKMVPFLPVFDVVTYALVIYYIYWMFKQK